MAKNLVYDELVSFFSQDRIIDYHYVFLRFDESAVHKDCEVDLVVYDREFIPLLRDLVSYYVRLGYSVKNFRKTAYMTQTTFYKDGYHVKYHIVTKVVKVGYMLYNPNEIYRRDWWFVDENGLKRIKPDAEAGLMIIRNFINSREFSDKHKELLKKADMKRVRRFVEEDMGCVWKEGPGIRSRKAYRSIWRFIRGLFRNTKSKLLFFLERQGKVVALYGPDGSGKSTLNKYLLEKLNEGENLNKGHNFFSYSLFDLRNKSHSSKKAIKRVKQAHDSRVKTYIKNVLSYTERVLMYPVKIVPYKFMQYTLTFDRFYLDCFTKSRRYQKYYFKHLEALFGFFFPNPELTILLVGNAEKIIERKDELTKKQIKDIYNWYDELFEKYPQHVVEVDINGSLQETKKKVFEAYLAWRTAETKKSLSIN